MWCMTARTAANGRQHSSGGPDGRAAVLVLVVHRVCARVLTCVWALGIVVFVGIAWRMSFFLCCLPVLAWNAVGAVRQLRMVPLGGACACPCMHVVFAPPAP